MNKFGLHAGDLVECVDFVDLKPGNELKKGNIYTIRDIRKDQYGGEFYVYLEEIGNVNDGWYSWRFRKIEQPSRKFPNRLFTKFRMLRFEL